MADVKKQTKEELLAKGYVYVTIPDTDLFNESHPSIRINLDSYGPGTHLVSSTTAREIEERLEAFRRSQIRILQPGQDRKAVQIVTRFGSAPVKTEPLG